MVATLKQASRSKQKRTSATGNVAKAMLDKASLTLAELPEKTKETLSMKEAVKFLAEPITTAIAKGYSLEDIASLLSKEGIEITPASLKYYLAKVQPKAKQGRGKARKPRQTRVKSVETSSPTSVEASSESSSPIDPAPVPAAKGRRSTKSKPTQTVAKTKPATAAETTVASPETSKTTSEIPAKPKRSPRSTTKAAKAPAQAKSTTRRTTAQSKTKPTGTKRTSKSKAK